MCLKRAATMQQCHSACQKGLFMGVQVSGGSVYDQYSIFRPYSPLPLITQDTTWQCAFAHNNWVYIPPYYNLFYSNYR